MLMTAAARWTTLCFFSWVVLGWSSAVAFGEGSVGSGTPLSSEGGLVVPGVQSLDEGQQAQAQAQASLTNPEAVAEREASRTRYENEDQSQATQTLGAAFPAVVDKQDGGPPPLGAGETLLGFKSANVEQITMGSGYVGLVQSTAPIAVSTGASQWAAVDLAPQQVGGGFEALRPLVTVRIPK